MQRGLAFSLEASLTSFAPVAYAQNPPSSTRVFLNAFHTADGKGVSYLRLPITSFFFSFLNMNHTKLSMSDGHFRILKSFKHKNIIFFPKILQALSLISHFFFSCKKSLSLPSYKALIYAPKVPLRPKMWSSYG